MHNKAVIYVRVSSKEQEESGFSIPAQRKLLVEYAASNHFQIVNKFEEAETAKKAGRSAFNRMLQFLNANPDITHVLVEKTDRLYRNLTDYNALNFESMGLNIHLVKEGEILNIKSRSHQKFIHGIKVLMAKNYSDNLSEEVKKGQTQKAEEGEWPSKAPIGYRNRLEDHVVVPDPQAAPLIRLAFELMASASFSLSKLKRELFKRGLRAPRSKVELNKSSMQRILSNSFYYGDFAWNGKVYAGTHEPLIDKKLFDKVQQVMGLAAKAAQTKRDFAFTGLISCSHCGCAITAEEHRKKSGKVYIYYHCTNGRGLCEKIVYLPEAKLELQMRRAIQAIKLPEEVVQMTRIALLASSKEEQEMQALTLSKLNKRYAQLQTLIGSAYEDKLLGKIESDFWEAKTSEWKREQAEIQRNIAALKSADTNYMIEGIRLLELAERASDLFQTMESTDKRRMLKNILLNPRLNGRTLEYDYEKPFSMFVNITSLEEWRERRDLNPRPPA